MTHLRSTAAATVALPALLALASMAHGQQDPAQGNKAAKPPVEAAASQSDVATRKRAKPGAQAGPTSPDADAAAAAKGNKAGKPSVAEAASRAGVATRKPAKSGTQSGAAPASAP